MLFHPTIYDPAVPAPSWWFDSASREGVDYPPLEGDRRCEIAVIGGGYTGLSAAYHLAGQYNMDVRLLEVRLQKPSSVFLPPEDFEPHAERLAAVRRPEDVSDVMSRFPIRMDDLSAETKRRILCGTAIEFLGLDVGAAAAAGASSP